MTAMLSQTKKILLLLTIGLFVLSGTIVLGSVIYKAIDGGSEGIAVSVSDSPDKYVFSARYDKTQTANINGLLRDSLQQYINLAFNNNDHIYARNATDKISLELDTYPGKCKLVLYKQESSAEAYETCKRIGSAIVKITRGG